jgi:mannose-6-phosphate isomerase-like protein (cupin superfamily)
LRRRSREPAAREIGAPIAEIETPVLLVVDGRANTCIGGTEHAFEAGSTIRCAPGVKHNIRNLSTGRCSLVFLKLAVGLLDAVAPSTAAKTRPAAAPA